MLELILRIPIAHPEQVAEPTSLVDFQLVLFGVKKGVDAEIFVGLGGFVDPGFRGIPFGFVYAELALKHGAERVLNEKKKNYAHHLLILVSLPSTMTFPFSVMEARSSRWWYLQ